MKESYEKGPDGVLEHGLVLYLPAKGFHPHLRTCLSGDLRSSHGRGMLARMSHREIEKTLLFEESAPFVADADTLDLARLRQAFLTLFDRVSHELSRRGLDLDGVLVERFLHCQTPDGASVRVPLPFLADRSSVVGLLTTGEGVERHFPDEAAMSIVEITAAVILEDHRPF